MQSNFILFFLQVLHLPALRRQDEALPPEHLRPLQGNHVVKTVLCSVSRGGDFVPNWRFSTPHGALIFLLGARSQNLKRCFFWILFIVF